MSDLTPQITMHSSEPIGVGCRRACLDSTGVFKVHLRTLAGWELQENLVPEDEGTAKFHITMAVEPAASRDYYEVVSSAGAQRLEIFGDGDWNTVYRWSVPNDMGEWVFVPASTFSLRERCQLLMQMSLLVTSQKRR